MTQSDPPRHGPKRRPIDRPPRPLPRRETELDVLEKPPREREFDEPSRGRENNGFDPNVNSVPR